MDLDEIILSGLLDCRMRIGVVVLQLENTIGLRVATTGYHHLQSCPANGQMFMTAEVCF
jgi:hypothetical protein